MTIDTSTTAGKIEVMQAFERGDKCEWHYRYDDGNKWRIVEVPSWDWEKIVYRIQPELREFYIVMDKNGPWRVHCNDARAHANAEECQRNAPRDGNHYVIKVREVIE